MICRFLRQKLFTGTLSVDSPEKSCSQPAFLSIFKAAVVHRYRICRFSASAVNIAMHTEEQARGEPGAEPVSRGPWNNGAGAPLCRESLLTQGSRIILPCRKGSHSSLSLPPARTGSGQSPETKAWAGRPSGRVPFTKGGPGATSGQAFI